MYNKGKTGTKPKAKMVINEDVETSSEEKMEREPADCAMCDKEVTKKQYGIACDYCESWFHNGCVKIGREDYKVLQNNKSLTWFCRECRGSYRNMKVEY
ncbi:uncharacterized protein [Palaemon carinicauda]|uniref:uncharacterized protein n=1 Tax=Palaemon carinicauda TaxID=392227 RepID=UPI0035B6A200